MSDAASLLAWGRSIVAAKRGGGTIPDPPAALAARDGGAVTPGSSRLTAAAASHSVPATMSAHSSLRESRNATPSEDESADPVTMEADGSVTAHHRSETSAAPVRPSHATEYYNAASGSAAEAVEPHWARRDKVNTSSQGRTAAAIAPTEKSSAPHVSHTGTDTEGTPVSSPTSGHRRRGHTFSGLPASKTLANRSKPQSNPPADSQSAVLVLRQQEELLQRRVDAEKKHAADLATMLERNQAAFLEREAELLRELEVLPKVIEAAQTRRSARLLGDGSVVQEGDVKQLEDILWALENEIHTSTELEAIRGTQVGLLAQSAAVCQQLAKECVEQCHAAVYTCQASIVPAAEDVLLRCESAAWSARDDTRRAAHVGGVQAPELSRRAAEALEEALCALKLRVHSLHKQHHTADSSDADVATPAALLGHVSRTIHPPLSDFVNGLEEFMRALDEYESQRSVGLVASLRGLQVQVESHKATMDEAKVALEELNAERQKLVHDAKVTQEKIASTEAAIDAAVSAREADVQRAQTVIEQRGRLEAEVMRLRDHIASSTKEFAAAEQETRRSTAAAGAKRKRCEDVREQARAARAAMESGETELAAIQRSLRAKSTEEQQLLAQLQRVSEQLSHSRQRVSDVSHELIGSQNVAEKAKADQRNVDHELQDVVRRVAEADRSHALATSSIEEMRQELECCRQETLELRQRMADVQRQLATSSENVEDVEEELEVARAVLLHQEGAAKKSAKRHDTPRIAVASSAWEAQSLLKLAADDHRVLFEEPPLSPLPRQQRRTAGGYQAAAADVPSRLAVPSGSRSRSRQWGRSESRSTSEVSPTAASTVICPPDVLDTVEPPSAWQRLDDAHSTFVPITVVPQPRHFQKEMNALLEARERGRLGLMAYLTDDDDGATHETRSSASEFRSASPPPPPDPSSLMQNTWEPAAVRVVGGGAYGPNFASRGIHFTDSTDEKSSAFSSAPSSDAEGGFRDRLDKGAVSYESQFGAASAPQPPFMQAPMSDFHTAGGNAALHARGHAPAEPAAVKQALRDRLTLVKNRLHRVVADSTADESAKRRPFR